MNKQLLFVLCCVLLLAVLAFSVTAQEGTCQVDYGQLQSALNNLLTGESAVIGGDSSGALAYLAEARTLMETLVNACNAGGRLNWCYPGQPWGDGRCNGPDLTQDEIDWFWACGNYWAEYEAGLTDGVPDWCGCNTDVDADCDGTPDSQDQCPGAPDQDSDGDGTLDCNDQCPNDPNKIAPGICDCGVSDTTDSDGDGVADCVDACPLPGDDWQVSDYCIMGPGCFIVTAAMDIDDDGCSDTRSYGPGGTGCGPGTPPCS